MMEFEYNLVFKPKWFRIAIEVSVKRIRNWAQSEACSSSKTNSDWYRIKLESDVQGNPKGAPHSSRSAIGRELTFQCKVKPITKPG